MNKTLAKQYYEICPTVVSLKILCDNKCDASFRNEGHYCVWIFEDDSIIRIDDNLNVTVDGVIK